MQFQRPQHIAYFYQTFKYAIIRHSYFRRKLLPLLQIGSFVPTAAVDRHTVV